MTSDIIRKQVEDIQGQWAERLQELSIIVLLLLIFIFFDEWFSGFIMERDSKNTKWRLFGNSRKAPQFINGLQMPWI